MKKQLLILFIIFISVKGFAQQAAVPYYDAIYIKQHCYNAVNDELKSKTNLIAVLKNG